MKNNFPKTPFFLSILLLIFSCSLFYFLYNKIENNYIIAKEFNIEAQKKINYLDELRDIDRGIKIIEKETTELEKHFVYSSNLVPFLDAVEKLASTVNVAAETSFVNISPDNLSLIMGLNAKGSFRSLYKFFTLLENSVYELKFVSLDIFKEVTQNTKNISKWETNIVIELISFIN